MMPAVTNSLHCLRSMIYYGHQRTLVCLAKPPDSKRRVYYSASVICSDMGGYLASAKTPEKLQLLIDMAEGKHFWVGLDDKEEETAFVWMEDGSPLTPQQTRDVFLPGEPNHGNMEHCVGLIAPDVKLIDRNCGAKWNYFCEAKPEFC